MTLLKNRLILIICIFIKQQCQAVSRDEMYPFGNEADDLMTPVIDDGGTDAIAISTAFPLFNNQHNQLYVNNNGVISFLARQSQYTPIPFPLNDGRRIIAPFWTDVDTRNGGTIWYRETTDTDVLETATEDVQRYFPEQTRFHAAWVFIATWDKVAFYGADYHGRTKTNTFQVVLITNGRHSFTIFLYSNVEWTTGTASGGSSTTGLGGTPAQVGFNAGDGVNYYSVEGSLSADIIHITSQSNVMQPGIYAFQIDKETIENGGCNTKGNLIVTPRYRNMLGGEELVVSGPCIEETAYIIATYGATHTNCDWLSEFSVRCITPMLYQVGTVEFTLNITNEMRNMEFSGQYTSVDPSRLISSLHRLSPEYWYANTNQTLDWHGSWMETSIGKRLDVFTVENTFNGAMIMHAAKLTSDLDIGTAEYTFSMAAFSDFIDKPLILRLSSSSQDARGIWSDVFMIQQSNQVAKIECQHWLWEEEFLPFINTNFQPCPCNTTQALLDAARFEPDPLCKVTPETNDINCLHRPLAKQCFRSSRSSPSGNGRLCCYDEEGRLLNSLQRTGGGTVYRYHHANSGRRVIPYLSYSIHEVAPYLQCCRFSNDLCSVFFDFRPPSSCSGYVAPQPARGNGDPHIQTFDGRGYTFNGAGEFILMKDEKGLMEVQVRAEQYTNSNGTLVSASVFTSVAAKTRNTVSSTQDNVDMVESGSTVTFNPTIVVDTTVSTVDEEHFTLPVAVLPQPEQRYMSDTVEVRLNTIRGIDLLINGITVEIADEDSIPTIEFSGGSATFQNTNNEGKQITLALTDVGVSLIVEARNSMLSILPLIGSETLFGTLLGLLGNYDGDPSNDLMSRNGTLLPSDSSLRDIHYNFGVTWATSTNESLFTYPIGKTHDSYLNPNFVPILEFPSIENVSGIVLSACENNIECIFDYVSTGSIDVAESTRSFDATFAEVRMTTVEVITCGFLPIVENGAWNASGYTLGNTAILVCNNGFTPSGTQYSVCDNLGNWNDTETVYCNTTESSTSSPAVTSLDLGTRPRITALTTSLSYSSSEYVSQTAPANTSTAQIGISPVDTTQQTTTPPVDTTQQTTTAPVDTTQQTITAPVDTTQQITTPPVDTTQQTTTASVHTTQQITTHQVDSTQQTTTPPVDTTQQTTTPPVDTTQQTTTPPVDTTQQTTTPSVDTTQQTTTPRVDITSQTPSLPVDTTTKVSTAPTSAVDTTRTSLESSGKILKLTIKLEVEVGIWSNPSEPVYEEIRKKVSNSLENVYKETLGHLFNGVYVKFMRRGSLEVAHDVYTVDSPEAASVIAKSLTDIVNGRVGVIFNNSKVAVISITIHNNDDDIVHLKQNSGDACQVLRLLQSCDTGFSCTEQADGTPKCTSSLKHDEFPLATAVAIGIPMAVFLVIIVAMVCAAIRRNKRDRATRKDTMNEMIRKDFYQREYFPVLARNDMYTGRLSFNDYWRRRENNFSTRSWSDCATDYSI